MATLLYVGGLSFTTTSNSLNEAFARFGEISAATVVMDALGRSRGFGFVTFTDDAAANAAVAEMNGTELEGRTITVGVSSLSNPPLNGKTSSMEYLKVGNLNVGTPPQYADNTTALAGGLVAGDVYITLSGSLSAVY